MKGSVFPDTAQPLHSSLRLVSRRRRHPFEGDGYQFRSGKELKLGFDRLPMVYCDEEKRPHAASLGLHLRHVPRPSGRRLHRRQR